VKDHLFIETYKNLSTIKYSHLFLIFLFIGLVIYSNAIINPFVHDDLVFIQLNPEIKNLNLSSIFHYPSQPQGQSSIINDYYRPLLELLYRMEFKLFGYAPYGYHFVNILFHIINSFLLFAVLNKIFLGKKTINFVVSFFYLVHPVQSEAVSTIAGISNLVFVFFCLLSFLCYLIAKEKVGLRSGVFHFIALVFFIGGLLSKEQAVIFPGLIILYEITRQERKKITLKDLLGPVPLYFNSDFIFTTKE